MATETEQSEILNQPKSSSTQNPSAISLSIWPPSQRTRDAVTDRLLRTLTDPTSILIERYGGAFPHDEAASVAATIEQEAYAAADSDESSRSEDIEAGIKVVELYSKEVSRRTMDFVKNSRKEADVRKEADETGVESVENEAPAAA